MILYFFLACVLLDAQTKLEAAFNASYASEKKGEYKEAIKAIESVYDISSYELNLRMGWLQYMGGFFHKSATYYKKAIELMPLSIEAKFGVVYPVSAMGNWDEVISYYEEILRIDPQNSVVNYRMGSIYYGNEDYSKSFTYLEKVVNLYPFDYDGLILFAWCNLNLGKYKEAKALFQKSLLLNPDDSSAKEGLSLIK